MAINPRRIEFRTAEDVARHLNAWSATNLTTPEEWNDVLLSSRQWLDYSARNQILLASYGADGPVAGAETWRLVPSTTEGRQCAVRAGEHGWPVRVPVTTAGSEPDPYLGGTRPTRAAVERFEWRPVFEIRQLARRPAPGSLVPVELPERLTGRRARDAYLDAVRKVARTTVRGRLPRSSDPHQILAEAAVRLSRGARQPPLEPLLAEQAAWLVADRVGLAPGDLPAFDPEPLEPRDRWQVLRAVLDPANKLTGTLGRVVGVDLTASPLPKMEIVDDRVVPAGRRRRLPAASLAQLPVGEWAEVGPYTPEEWAARGETGAGRGAYLRLNRSAYIVAVEQGVEAAWRLEDVADRTGHGLLATGTAPSLDEAKRDATAALQGRYPALAQARAAPVAAAPLPAGAATAWEPVPGTRSAAAQRRLSDDVIAYALPGPGGRWRPAVLVHGELRLLSSVRTHDEARDTAELAGRRTVRQLARSTPVGLDGVVADLATGPDYSRVELAELIQDRLEPETRNRLTADDLGPEALVELLGAAGCTAATTVLVLRAENVDAAEVARLLPTIGVPMPDAIRVLHEHWQIPRVRAAEALGATATEMRTAGCTPTEIMAARPRDVLRTLPTEPRSWGLAAATMSEAGHAMPVVVSHLVAHAPTPDAFAEGLATVAPDPTVGLATAVRYGAQADHLVAASELYGLSPSETATALADIGAATQVAVEAIYARCDTDPDVTADIAGPALALDPDEIHACLAVAAGRATDLELAPTPDATAGIDPTDAASLLASLPEPEPGNGLADESLLEHLPPPEGPAVHTPDLTEGDP